MVRYVKVSREVMARIFRHAYTVFNKETGRRELRKTRNWYIEYRDENGKWRKAPGYRDKLATQRKATQLEANVLSLIRGEVPKAPPGPGPILLSELDGYLQHLRDKADTPRHVRHTRQMVAAVLAGVAVERFGELKRRPVARWLAEQRERGKFGIATSNHYARALKGFSRWLAVEFDSADPLSGLPLLNEEVDRRRVRRVLSEADFSRLIKVTRIAPNAGRWGRGLSGADRAMLYQVAAYTGLRRAELLTLLSASFDVDSTPPCVRIAAKVEKSRRGAVLPLPPWLAAELREWLKGRTGRLWRAGAWLDTAAMLRRDLARAGIPYIDDQGRAYDFHALRSQYITGLARAGVSLMKAQRLARHSDPKLTAKHYTHLDIEDLAAEPGKIPPPQG